MDRYDICIERAASKELFFFLSFFSFSSFSFSFSCILIRIFVRVFFLPPFVILFRACFLLVECVACFLCGHLQVMRRVIPLAMMRVRSYALLLALCAVFVLVTVTSATHHERCLSVADLAALHITPVERPFVDTIWAERDPWAGHYVTVRMLFVSV